MNAFQKLRIEYDGIFGTIQEYTNDAGILNYLIKLNTAIDEADFETIQYCLIGIDKWYKSNIKLISQNQFVHNYDAHLKNKSLIGDILSTLRVEDCVVSNTRHKGDSHLIFISHKSDDKKYGDALRNFIIGLGVKDNELIYTSHPLHKIPMDANIYDYLRQNINSSIFMIILWSNEYLDSPACLNEMGALWVTQADYTNIYVPSFSFGNPKYHECAVDTRKMGAVLNGDQHCKASMIELKNKIQVLFGLEDDEQKSSFLLDELIKAITEEDENG